MQSSLSNCLSLTLTVCQDQDFSCSFSDSLSLCVYHSDFNPALEACYILVILVCVVDMCIVFPILMLTPAPYTPDENEDECDADQKTAVEGNQEVILLPAMGENNEPVVHH